MHLVCVMILIKKTFSAHFQIARLFTVDDAIKQATVEKSWNSDALKTNTYAPSQTDFLFLKGEFVLALSWTILILNKIGSVFVPLFFVEVSFAWIDR